MSAHTPGPWTWREGTDRDEGGLVRPDGRLVVYGLWRNDSMADCEAAGPANESLIAAAPDLLEAAQNTAQRLVILSTRMDDDDDTQPAYVREARELVGLLVAVIAKAEGR